MKELVDENDKYVDHLDHKSSTHRLNEINWESVAEIGEAVDAENRQAKQAQANTRKNSSKLRLGRKDTMVDMKPMPVSGHSRWPQMMTVTQPFMMKRGGQMSKTMQSHVIQQTQHNANTLKGNVVGDEEMDASLSPMMDRDVLHPLYFAINTTSKQGHYGHQNRILNCIIHLQLEIIDFRSWHEQREKSSGKGKHQITKDCFYVQDTITSLPPTRHLGVKQKAMLKERVREIRAALAEALSGKASNMDMSIKRWLPGVAKKDDTDGVSSPKGVSFDPQEAFKQAHSIMSMFEKKQAMAKAEQAKARGGNSKKAKMMAGAITKYGHPVKNCSVGGDADSECEEEEVDSEEMSYIYGDEDSQHQKLSMVEASESSSYGENEEDRSDTSDSRRREKERGMMSDTDIEDDDEQNENEQNETRYSIQIS